MSRYKPVEIRPGPAITADADLERALKAARTSSTPLTVVSSPVAA